MFTLTLETWLSAAHRIPGHRGKCDRLHGHNWRVRVIVRGSDGGRLLLQRGAIRCALEAVMENFDHHFLNALPVFSECNPTAENIARAVFDGLAAALGGEAALQGVSVWETPKYAGGYGL